MKLCSLCLNKPWPFAIAGLIALFAAFLTWLTLELSGHSPTERMVWTAVAFTAVGALLVSYMASCMRRHCKDDNQG